MSVLALLIDFVIFIKPFLFIVVLARFFSCSICVFSSSDDISVHPIMCNSSLLEGLKKYFLPFKIPQFEHVNPI